MDVEVLHHGVAHADDRRGLLPVLRLDDELDALDRRRARLGDGARDAARQEVGDE